MFAFILSFPKSIYFNFRYLPIKQAIKLPFAISYKTKINIKGKVVCSCNVKPFMIRIGFHHVPICNYNDETRITVGQNGVLNFRGGAHIGSGSKINVGENALLVFGDNFAISASSAINCYEKIEFGKDIQFSWNCLVMDSDTHDIIDDNGNVMNPDKPIIFGDKIWIGCNTTILKGSVIPSNCVIGANSLVSGHHFDANSIIVGNPAKSTKHIFGFII